MNMPSFDIVSKIDMSEVDNALNGIKRETQQRFDLKGTKAAVDRNGNELTILADNDLQLRQVQELLYTYFARRDVDSKALDFRPTEKASGDSLRQLVGIRQGIDSDTGRKIIKAIKGTKLKVQVAMQGDELRVTGKKRDDLQEAINFVKEMGSNIPLQYVNFRD
ncbi:MAG: YajQ family cyclic di-GMP-binding protein [Chloroflexi bacterium]|nr:YajQ family cyclic di-GMP-binding protein [Chloroflexota bacterium]|tara:strand:+ start:748 stop:1239 length:492 start_codon:yes stop_codon:yes gene_type:complete